MVVLSVLQKCNVLKTGLVNYKKLLHHIAVKNNNATQGPFRNMASDHHHAPKIFDIQPSRFQYTKFKDEVHFYLMLGIIPLGTLIFCVNVFIGPAELAEIPEGYEPKHWEYHKHPIKRFISRYFHKSEQEYYEQTLHEVSDQMDRIKWREKIDKVHMLMADRNDYRGPYFIPSDDGRQIRRARYEADMMDERLGYK